MKSKILTILGTRPEIIRLSRIISKLDQVADHKILHTGQNYDPNLSSVFFKDMAVREPNIIIDSKANNFAEQLSKILVGVEKFINEFCPNKILILGDTNSGLSAIIAERLGIPVYHMEAGNRCYDLKVPEEKNRKIIDSISTINMPYTWQSRENLLREGVPNDRIIVTGNPIKEVLDYYDRQISQSNILERLNLKKNQYVVATAHRSENVDDEKRLNSIIESLLTIAKELPVVFSCHPRTRQKIEKFKKNVVGNNFIVSDPFGFFDFVNLEKNSFIGITDSGTVQEEMCIFKKPTITIRDTTERPETVWCGSNIVSGLEKEKILECFERMKLISRDWSLPEGYERTNVSDTVINILLSN
jgi:UDP-N-acetylglucosamine 2-epimerase (non-hydrolysing)